MKMRPVTARDHAVLLAQLDPAENRRFLLDGEALSAAGVTKYIEEAAGIQRGRVGHLADSGGRGTGTWSGATGITGVR